jgi:hypothetical protein
MAEHQEWEALPDYDEALQNRLAMVCFRQL